LIGNIYKYHDSKMKVRVIAIEKYKEHEWVVYYYLDDDRRNVADTLIQNFYNRYTLYKEKNDPNIHSKKASPS